MENLNFEGYWKEIYELLPPLATREQVSKAVGGAIAPRTLANRDCFGTGIENKKVLGKKVVYPRADVVCWLQGEEKMVG